MFGGWCPGVFVFGGWYNRTEYLSGDLSYMFVPGGWCPVEFLLAGWCPGL